MAAELLAILDAYTRVEALAVQQVPWFPPALTVPLLVGKGLVALTATVLFVIHMMRDGHRIDGVAQWLRYIALLGASVLITGASGEQASELGVEGFVVAYRHIGSLIVSCLILAAAAASLYEGHRHRRTGP